MELDDAALVSSVVEPEIFDDLGGYKPMGLYYIASKG